MKTAAQYAFGYFVLFFLPIFAGVFSIIRPFVVYRNTHRQSALTVGILNSVFGGLAVLILVGTLIFSWMVSYLTYGLIGLSVILMLIGTWNTGSPPQPNAKPAPPRPPSTS